MARRIVRTPQSRRDVIEILRYLRRRTTQRAYHVRDAIEETIQFLSENLGAGPQRDELSPGLRSYPVHHYTHYLVIYQPLRDGVSVLSILHGSRDLPGQFTTG